MPQLVEMDRHVSLFEQMEEQLASVILINTFTGEPEEAALYGDYYNVVTTASTVVTTSLHLPQGSRSESTTLVGAGLGPC